MNTLRKVIIALTLSSLGFAFNSSATPISVWNWEVNTAFTGSTPGGMIGEEENDWWLDPTILYWGCETQGCNNETDAENSTKDISSLDVSSSSVLADVDGYDGTPGEVKGEGLMSGDSVQTSSIIHNNNPIYGSSLLTATLSAKLFLTPFPLDAETFTPDILPLIFNIVFTETPNSNGCDYNVDEADLELHLLDLEQIHCEDDIFVIDTFGTGGDFNPFDNTFNQTFTDINGYTYNIALSVDSLGTLPDEVCARVAGAANPGCVGVTTHENASTPIGVHMMITLIPEPSTILLMALALFGLAASARNRQV